MAEYVVTIEWRTPEGHECAATYRIDVKTRKAATTAAKKLAASIDPIEDGTEPDVALSEA